MLRLPKTFSTTRVPILFLQLICLTAAASTARAAFDDVGFVLNMSAKEMVLANPGDMMAMKYSAWDTPTQRIADLNMPFLALTNDVDSDAPITQFTMSIGDTNFHFSNLFPSFGGSYVKLGDTTPGFDLQATTENNEDLLKVIIGDGGLMPGETVRFRVDIDVDPGHPELYPHQDYRLVFFDMNGNSTADNSIVTSVFSEGGMTEQVSAQLQDYPSDNDQFVNGDIRPYSVMVGIDVFTIAASETNVIPEPISISLLSLAAIGLLASKSRRRD
jgi:hypothetical protein